MTSSVKLKHLKKYLDNARSRATKNNIPFDITLEDLVAIATDKCPIFGTNFQWGSSKLGKGNSHTGTPQLDRIIPRLGYTKGNVAFLSKRANKMKDDGTMEEHYAIADWIWEQKHARENPTTSLSDPNHKDIDNDTELRALSTAWLGKNSYDFDDYIGAIYRHDFDHRPEESGGDCVGAGSFEMEPSETSAYIEGIRYSVTKITRHLNRLGYLYRKFRERCLADGAMPELPELSDRREQPIQRPIDQEIQSPQKAFEGF
mgnify:FL=1